MQEEEAQAGNGPADQPASGGYDQHLIEDEYVPSSARLRASVGECLALMRDCGGMARDTNQAIALRSLAAATAARLAAASAQAGGALARLADAETRQRLANAKLEGLGYAPRSLTRTAPQEPSPSHSIARAKLAELRRQRENNYDAGKATFNSETGNSEMDEAEKADIVSRLHGAPA